MSGYRNLLVLYREIMTFCSENRTKDTWGVQVVRYPNFFSGMEADRNVKVVGGDVAVL